MRNSPIEILMIGCGIALCVLLVQALTQGASALTQLLALLAAGLVLFCVQLALSLRRARHDNPPPQHPSAPLRPRRGRRRNPFVRELTDDWTGLEGHLAESDLAGRALPDDLDDELWGAPPQAPVRKAVPQQADDSQQH
jgi:hypothetical protein